jgi:hypothetical protein
MGVDISPPDREFCVIVLNLRYNFHYWFSGSVLSADAYICECCLEANQEYLIDSLMVGQEKFGDEGNLLGCLSIDERLVITCEHCVVLRIIPTSIFL